MAVRAWALPSGVAVSAWALPSGVAVNAWALPSGVAASARPTDAVSLLKYLRVKPVDPQTLVWLVPQYGIDYTIESNTNWNIK